MGAPAFALIFPAGVLVNAVFFHVLPTVVARRPNPGFLTAVLLYLPIGIWAYVAAADDGVLSAATVFVSVVGGATAMAAVIAVPMLQRRFRYPDVPATPPPAPPGG
ncbi:MAG: HXXEE domain-containing protein [Solirubrobacterales bacterium]